MSTPKLNAALVAAQKEASEKPLVTDKTYGAQAKNSGQRVAFAYPSAEAACAWARGILNKHGIAFVPASRNGVASKADGDERQGTPFIEHGFALVHESGESREFTVWAPICVPYGGDLSKGWKHARSSVLKYTLMDVLCVRAEADDEEPFHGTGASAQEKAEAALPPPPPLPPPAGARQEAPPKAAPLPPPTPAPGATASTTATASAALPPPPSAPSAATPPAVAAPPAPSAAPAVPTEADKARLSAAVKRVQAELDARGGKDADITAYLKAGAFKGREIDFGDMNADDTRAASAALEAWAFPPLAPKAPALPPPPPPPESPTSFNYGANAAPTPAKTVLDDPALMARWTVFKRDASQARVAKGVSSMDLLPIASAWGRKPGLFAAGKALEGPNGTEGEVTAEVLGLLEAGLAAWKNEPATALSAGGAR